MRDLQLLFIPVFCLSLIGCVSNEGISFESDSLGAKELVKYGALPNLPATEDVDQKRSTVTGLVAIGYTSSFRPIGTQNAEKLYGRYMKFYETWEVEREPVLSAQEFADSIAGWTRIKTFTIPLMWGDYSTCLVPKKLSDDIKFSDAATVALVQTTGDLVSAHTNEDGVYVLSSLLCKDELPLDKCAVNFKKGVFDSTTGQELDGRLKPKKNGVRIDLTTLKKVVVKNAEE